MKLLVIFPFCLAMVACKTMASASPGLEEELQAIRRDLHELKQLPPYSVEGGEMVDTLKDIEREIRKLKDQGAAASAPPAVPLEFQLPATTVGDMLGGVGSSAQGLDDLFWVLSKISVDGKGRTVLCLYQTRPGATGFDLRGVRLLDYDMQVIELNAGTGRGPSVRNLRDGVERQKQRDKPRKR